MQAVKQSPDYYKVFVLNFFVFLIILLGEAFCLAATPRIPNFTQIITAAFRAWTVLLITISVLWFTQDHHFNLSTKRNLIITGLQFLIGLTFLITQTYDMLQYSRVIE